MENLPLKRTLLILDSIVDLVKKDSEKTSFDLPVNHFSKIDKILNDDICVEKSFKKITSETKGEITINFSIRYERTDSPQYNPIFQTFEKTGVNLHIENPNFITQYRDQVINEINQTRDQLVFELEPVDKKAFLTIKNTANSKIYSLTKKSNRYRLILLLAQAKVHLSTSEIAKHLNITNEKVWELVDGVRGNVSRVLEVPRNTIISNSPETEEGYGFLNIELKS